MMCWCNQRKQLYDSYECFPVSPCHSRLSNSFESGTSWALQHFTTCDWEALSFDQDLWDDLWKSLEIEIPRSIQHGYTRCVIRFAQLMECCPRITGSWCWGLNTMSCWKRVIKTQPKETSAQTERVSSAGLDIRFSHESQLCYNAGTLALSLARFSEPTRVQLHLQLCAM